jgi:hypothetical protein
MTHDNAEPGKFLGDDRNYLMEGEPMRSFRPQMRVFSTTKDLKRVFLVP